MDKHLVVNIFNTDELEKITDLLLPENDTEPQGQEDQSLVWIDD